jgi:flagellar motility protein MotE (MotC chaperone)
MKLLQSGWALAILAALMNLGTTGGLIYFRWNALLHNSSESAGATKDALPHFWSFRADEVDALIAELNTERSKLLARQDELDKLAAHIEADRQELEKTRSDVAAMRDEIAAKIPEVQDSEKKNLKALAQTYATINPQAAVAIFRQMDEMTCAKLLSQMKPDKVAAILQEMSQEDKDDTLNKRAARISDKLRLMLAAPTPPPA